MSGFTEEQLNELFNDFTFLPMVDYYFNTADIDKSGFITTCPNYNRVKQKAICIEIKNLNYNCLENEYLDKIISEINNQLSI